MTSPLHRCRRREEALPEEEVERSAARAEVAEAKAAEREGEPAGLRATQPVARKRQKRRGMLSRCWHGTWHRLGCE